ncbi:MAG: sigma 54-interacting transcriptional regulator [Bdellovibrionales bacterium]
MVECADSCSAKGETDNATSRSGQDDRASCNASRLSVEKHFLRMLGDTKRNRATVNRIAAYIASDLPILLTGETGTGKEVVTREIHRRSRRAEGPLVAINCGALPSTLVEDELFGHEKGAFTGALTRHRGALERADGGILFLDEVAELSTEAQKALLRVLSNHDSHSRGFWRIGGENTVSPDVRVIAATHQDLAAEVRAGRFREDLFHRLNVARICLPPLRERPVETLNYLSRHFLEQEQGKDSRMHKPKLTREAMRSLAGHKWPGNVRELETTIARAYALAAYAQSDINEEFIEFGEPIWPEQRNDNNPVENNLGGETRQEFRDAKIELFNPDGSARKLKELLRDIYECSYRLFGSYNQAAIALGVNRTMISRVVESGGEDCPPPRAYKRKNTNDGLKLY